MVLNILVSQYNKTTEYQHDEKILSCSYLWKLFDTFIKKVLGL